MHLQSTATAALFCALATALPAETAPQSPTLETATPLGVFAVEGTQSDFKTTSSRLAIPLSVGLNVSAYVNNASSATLVGFNAWTGGVVTVDIAEQGGASVAPSSGPSIAGTSPSPSATNYQPGPHALRLTLRGTPGSRGLIEMWATGGLSAPGSITGGYQIDVGEDQSLEFDAPLLGFTRQSLVVQIPASGTLPILLRSEAKATQTAVGSFLYSSGMSLRFTPAPLHQAHAYGATCGPELAGTATPSGTDVVFDVKLTKGTPLAAGLLVVGTTPIEVAVPGIQCPLLTVPLITLGFSIDAQGAAGWQFRVPLVIEFDLRLQAAELGVQLATASHGLHVVNLR